MYYKLPLKHAGSKYKQLKWLFEHIPKDATCFYDLFCGLGTVGVNYAVQNKCALVLGDLDERISRLYGVMGDNVETQILCKRLKDLFDSDEPNYEYLYGLYKRVRNTSEEFNSYAEVYKCAIECFLNRCSYGGLWRVNSRGEYNVPYSKRSKKVMDSDALERFAQVYRDEIDAKFSNQSYLALMDWEIPEGSVFYFDPPYDGTFQAYTKEFFDLYEFGCVCRELRGRGHRVYVSQSDTERVRSMFEGWNVVEYECRKAIASNSNTRAKEILVWG